MHSQATTSTLDNSAKILYTKLYYNVFWLLLFSYVECQSFCFLQYLHIQPSRQSKHWKCMFLQIMHTLKLQLNLSLGSIFNFILWQLCGVELVIVETMSRTVVSGLKAFSPRLHQHHHLLHLLTFKSADIQIMWTWYDTNSFECICLCRCWMVSNTFGLQWRLCSG